MRMYVRPHVPSTLLISRLVPKSIAELGSGWREVASTGLSCGWAVPGVPSLHGLREVVVVPLF